MNSEIKIALTPQAEKIVAGFETLPGRLVAAIAQGMDQGNQFAVANIQRKHLTGKGPFPVDQHKLGVRSGLMRESVFASDAQQTSGTQVQSAIGTPVKYAGPHEFGGVIHHPARQLKLRHKIDQRGNLLKQGTNGKLLVFARKGAKRVRETTVQGKAYDVTMPERAPFRTGLAESMPEYTRCISRNVVNTWKELGR